MQCRFYLKNHKIPMWKLMTIMPALMALVGLGANDVEAGPKGPSFDCGNADGNIEEMICSDEGLSALDNQLAEVYGEASRKAANEYPPFLKAEQRGWIKGRNDCWKSDDSRECTEIAYQLRIAELQARYRLLAGKGPYRYECDGDPRNEVVVTFFPTDPPTLIAERGGQVSVMTLQPSGSGSKYQGRNQSFWEHQGEATVVWGYGQPEMICSSQP